MRRSARRLRHGSGASNEIRAAELICEGKTAIPTVTRLTECLEQFLPPTIHATETLQGLIAGFTFCFKDGELVGDPKIHNIMTAEEQKIETWLIELQAQDVELNMGLSQAVQLLKNRVNGVSINLIGKAPSYSMKDAHAALRTAATLVIKEK
ncbi:hypothetical protein [Boudabousia marimammalium]|uniref:BetI-type transcriptional repressor C-terminal domain-containing protein n=1 Tax=Boudabousia marimammalium TaxID=156892 RepID=A0A1Q5PLX4_9ACTO|nr:hypothetical protein [Boudabousia marimammalium]OKL48061.1 hypothetical protein BM477_06225 [Boudabousia marimammalium]